MERSCASGSTYFHKKPKVYVSSTCHDFKHLRAEVKRVLEEWGFDPFLSEYTEGFPVDLGVDSYKACLSPVEKSDVFVLIIGTRCGGIVPDEDISITELEYKTACENNIPRINFCLEEVWNLVQVWKRNPSMEFPKHFDEGQKIMSFLERIRKIEKAKVDNWVHRFATVVDLKDILRTQLENAFLDHQFIGFEDYVQQILYDYENHEELLATGREPLIKAIRLCDLDKFYIDLECLSYTDGRVRLVDSFLEEWLMDEERNRLLLLGDCGTGKTSYCLYLTYGLAKSFAENPAKSPIPIFVPLKNYSLYADLRSLIISTLSEYGLRIYTFDVFQRLLASSTFILIFDGFDEMAIPEEKQNLLNNLNEIGASATPNTKIVLTSRTNFFKSQEQIEKLISSPLPLEIMRERKYEMIELKEFDPARIKELLSRRTDNWEYYWDIIKNTYNLRDLARRPLLLDMIIETLPELIRLGREINPTELYETYTQTWIQRGIPRFTIITREEMELLMERLACQMFLSSKYNIHYTKLRDYLRDEFRQEIFKRRELDCFEKDTRSCTFLNRTKIGNYEFVHRSFMEFFVAKKFAREIESQNIEDFGKERLTPEVADFLAPMVRSEDILYRVVESTKGKSFDKVKYLGGNALTLLNLMGKSLFNRDFSNAVLRGANLQGAKLESSNFSNADMREVNLNNANLRQTDFTNADLEGASLGESGEIRAIAFSPDTRHVVVGRYNGDVKTWNLETGVKQLEIKGHTGSVWTVCYSPDGKYIASGGWDGYVKVWNAYNGNEVQAIKAHDGSVWCVAWSPDGNYIASSGSDKIVKVWNPITAEEIRTFPGHTKPVLSVCWSPDSRLLASGSYDKTAKIWDMKKDREVTTLKGHSDFVWCVDFSQQGDYIATGSWDRLVKIWDVQETAEVATFSDHLGSVWCIAWSPDGNHIASGSGDSKLRIYDLKTRKLKFTLQEFSGLIFCVRYSSDGKYLAWAGNNGFIIAWDTKNHVLFRKIAVERKRILDCEGMKIRGIEGLSEDRIRFIKSRGAVE